VADDPDLTEDGYPTEQTLKRVREAKTVADALDLVECAWHWDCGVTHELSEAEREIVRASVGDRFLRLATGGWSGNESLIAALERNWRVMSMSWQLSARGGLHILKKRTEEGS
jgi:hypothetical protein